MTRNEQKRFVRSLCDAIRKATLEKIAAGVVPDSWDGHELREYLADEFDRERSLKRTGQTRRLRAFRNDCAVRGGL